MKAFIKNNFKRAVAAILVLLVAVALFPVSSVSGYAATGNVLPYKDGTPFYITNSFGEQADTSFIVQWHNAANVPQQRVQVALKDDTTFQHPVKDIKCRGEQFASGTPVGTYGGWGDFPARNVFRVEITGLESDTEYIYRVGGASGKWSPTYSHRTADNSNDFEFIVATDPQAPTHDRMVDTFNDAVETYPRSKFFIHCGDLVDQIETNYTEIDSYTNAAAKFNVSRPIMATQGNHDTYMYETKDQNTYKFNNARTFNRFVCFPENGYQNADKDASQSYYFYYNNVLIVVLNSMVSNQAAGHAKQNEWLEGVLKANKEGNLSQYVIVCTHVGLFGGRSDERYYAPEIRKAYMKTFSKYNVDVVFSGHDHVYGRSNRVFVDEGVNVSNWKNIDFEDDANGTVYNVVGATGPKFYELESGNHQTSWYAQKVGGEEDITPGMYMHVKVSGEKLSVTAKVTGKAVLDEYEVPAKRSPTFEAQFRPAVVEKVGVTTAALTVRYPDYLLSNVVVKEGETTLSEGASTSIRLTNLTPGARHTLTLVCTTKEGATHTETVEFTTLPVAAEVVANACGATVTALYDGVAAATLMRGGEVLAQSNSAQITVKGLRSNSEHRLQMVITASDGKTTSSEVTVVTSAFVAKSAGGFSVSADGVEGAASYKIYLNGDLWREGDLSTTQFAVGAMSSGGKYLYKVQLLGSGGEVLATDYAYFVGA